MPPTSFPFVGRLVLTVTLLCATAGLAEDDLFVLRIQAVDQEGAAVPGVRFAYSDIETPDTTDAGWTELRLPGVPSMAIPPGMAIGLRLPASGDGSWFLINAYVQVPAPDQPPAKIVLMKREALRRLAADLGGLSEGERWRAIAEDAARYGVDAARLTDAIKAFQEFPTDLMDQASMALASKDWTRAEALYRQALAAAEKREDEGRAEAVAETARYLGAALSEQGKYPEAAEAFRKSLAAREDDPAVMGYLGSVLHKSGELKESETWKRRALEADEVAFGPAHPNVARDQVNLALLLVDMNRPEEAEPLLRQALEIHEVFLEPEDPYIARDLGTLARVLQKLNRPEEAEPLARRAVSIFKAALEPEDPYITDTVKTLADILRQLGRNEEAAALEP